MVTSFVLSSPHTGRGAPHSWLRPCRGAGCACVPACSQLAAALSPHVFQFFKSLLTTAVTPFCPCFCQAFVSNSFLVEVLYCGLAQQVMS